MDALEAGDVDRLRQLFTSFLAGIPYSMRRKSDERERERWMWHAFLIACGRRMRYKKRTFALFSIKISLLIQLFCSESCIFALIMRFDYDIQGVFFF